MRGCSRAVDFNPWSAILQFASLGITVQYLLLQTSIQHVFRLIRGVEISTLVGSLKPWLITAVPVSQTSSSDALSLLPLKI